MKLENVVPWGRSRSEYLKMFDLKDGDDKKRVLGCGDGPSSFNYESGEGIISMDPIYAFSEVEIRERINSTYEIVKEQLHKNMDDFIWSEFKSVDELCSHRLKSMELFLSDYNRGKGENRYVEGALPEIPFADNSFDLVLSSHFLFLYSRDFDLDFHIESIKSMLRVGREVKIFPLIDLDGKRSPHLDGVLNWLEGEGFSYRINRVNYEFQLGAHEHLQIFS